MADSAPPSLTASIMTLGLKDKNPRPEPGAKHAAGAASAGCPIWAHLLWSGAALACLEIVVAFDPGAAGRSAPVAAVAFGVLVIALLSAERRRPRSGRFGAANAVTLVRAVLVCFLAGYIGGTVAPGDAWSIVAIAGLGLALDGVDGWLARRFGLGSEFGAVFDQETDAALILVLCVLAAQTGKVGWWILASGALRYLWIGAGFRLAWMRRPLPFSQRRRVICVIQVGALIVALIPLTPIGVSTPIAAASLVLLLASFATDFLWLAKRRDIEDPATC